MSIFSKGLLAAVAAAMALGGCADKPLPTGLATSIALADLTELPAPATGRAMAIGPQQELEITVLDAESLSGTYVTDAEGYVSFPLVGDLYLADKTLRQAEAMIADRLRGRFLVDPFVNVRPTLVEMPLISVGGEVVKPGNYPAATSASLLRAVNNAGGLDEYAKSDDVLVLRTVNGQRYIGVFNIEGIQRGNYPDPIIYPDDIVMVGESAARRRLETILQLVPLVSTAAILLERTVGN